VIDGFWQTHRSDRHFIWFDMVERLDRIIDRLDDMDARLNRLEKTERPRPSWNQGPGKEKAYSGPKK